MMPEKKLNTLELEPYSSLLILSHNSNSFGPMMQVVQHRHTI